MKNRTIRKMVGLLILVAASSACHRDHDEEHASSATTPAPADPDIVTLGPEMLKGAGIESAVADLRMPSPMLTVTGSVEPDQQRIQEVTSLVAGRVASAHAAIGDHVEKGAELAVLTSPEIADLQGRLLEARARQGVAESNSVRAQRLVAIGAAAGKDAQLAGADLQAANAELAHLQDAMRTLGGIEAGTGRSVAIVTLRAPIRGVVTARSVNPGAGVQVGQSLFTVTDLRAVWVIASVSETDLPRIGLGAQAVVSAPALMGSSITSTVDYIDPTLRADTHTAAVRVRADNTAGTLRLGMYVTVGIRTAPAGHESPMPWIPATAVDHIGDRTVVFQAVAGQPGAFRVRDVEVGEASGDFVSVLAGLRTGESVVIKGTFTLKSELLKHQFGENE